MFFKKKNYYFDYAGASPISLSIRKKLKAIQDLYFNPSGIYKEAVLVKKIINKSRQKILEHFDANNMRLVFTPSATTANNLAILGLLKKGDHFITSCIEHPSVLEVAKYLEKEGIEVTYLKVSKDGIIDLKELREKLKSNTKLISIMMVNNEIGTIQPIKEIGKIIADYKRENNIVEMYFHSDICQAVNYLDISMRSLRLDMISFNSSKIYGPKGVGALIFRKHIKLNPIIFGGGQEYNLWSGTEDVERIFAFAEAVDEANSLKAKEVKRLKELQKYFFEKIKKEVKEVIINGSLENRVVNNINITLPNMLSDEMVLRLDNLGFMISHKSACASEESEEGSYVLKAIGEDNYANQNIRITLGRETKKSDLDNLIKAIKNIYYKYRKI